MLTKIVDKETNEIIIGSVVTNHLLSFDDACHLAGLRWETWPDVDTDGWYQDGILWDEATAELVTENEF